MIRIPHSAYADMSAHAANVYPYECCGYITGTADPATWTVHRCRNIQNDLHARDPRQYPRDARTAYVFSQEDMTALFHGEFEPPDARAIGFDEGDKHTDWIACLEVRGIQVKRDVCRDAATRILNDYVHSGGELYNPRGEDVA